MWKLFYMREGGSLTLNVSTRLEVEVKELTLGVLKIVTIKLHNMAKEQVCILIDL